MITKIFSIPLVGHVIDFAAASIIGRCTVVALLILGMFAHGVYKGTLEINEASKNYNLSDTYYVIGSSSACTSMFRGSDLSIVKVNNRLPYAGSGSRCPPLDKASLTAIVDSHKYKTRGVDHGRVYFVYVATFVMFVIVTVLSLGNPYAPSISNAINGKSIMVGWLLVAAALFPMTYRDGVNGASHQLAGNSYYVRTAILSNDGRKYQYTSPYFLTMGRNLLAETPKNLDYLH